MWKVSEVGRPDHPQPGLVTIVLLLFPVANAASGATASSTEGPQFEEVSTILGIEFTHLRAAEERFWLPEIMSGGAAWLDYDGDGDLDLYLVQGGDLVRGHQGDPRAHPSPGNRLYRNDDAGGFRDVTRRALVGDLGYGMGAAAGDVDGDGAVDLYVTNVGANVLFINNRNGTFRRAARGVEDEGWGASAAFSDVDRDGDLDLFLVNYVVWSPANEVECYSGGIRDYCHPNRYNAPQADRLFRNRGDGTFDEVSQETGISQAFGNGLGVLPMDFNLDGWPDFYVANDGTPNQLWINLGDGRFRDRAVETGCAVNRTGIVEAGMGVATGDVDGDGYDDLLLTHLRQETNTLYLNRGEFCDDATARFGLAAPSINRTGFGTGLADFDHDGHLDLFVANGRVGVTQAVLLEGDPFAEPNQLFRGQAGGRFHEMPATATGAVVDNSRAAAFGDMDGDGDQDIAVVNNGARMRLLRNRAASGHHWARFRVQRRSGANALGGRVAIVTGDRVQTLGIRSAYGYCSAHEATATFGVGSAGQLESAQVTWPDGARRRLVRLPIDRTIVVYR